MRAWELGGNGGGGVSLVSLFSIHDNFVYQISSVFKYGSIQTSFSPDAITGCENLLGKQEL